MDERVELQFNPGDEVVTPEGVRFQILLPVTLALPEGADYSTNAPLGGGRISDVMVPTIQSILDAVPPREFSEP